MTRYQPPPPLDYAKAPRHLRRRRILKWLGAIVIAAVLVPLTIKYVRSTVDRLHVRRLYANCVAEKLPPATAVYDEDPVTRDPLLRQPQYQSVGSHHGKVAYRVSPAWREFCAAAGSTSIRSHGTLYLGERQTPSGERVLVGIDITGWSRGGPVILYASTRDFSRATALQRPQQATSLSTESITFGPTEGLLRIFAGQDDPSDPTHFSIAYTLDGTPGAIDGWMQQGGGVLLEPRPVATTLP